MKLLFQKARIIETIFSTFNFIDLDQVEKIRRYIKEYRESLGLNVSKMALKIGMSSQLLGQYEKSDGKTPGLEFLLNWKKAFGENLLEVIETKVSERSQSHTIETGKNDQSGHDQPDWKEFSLEVKKLADGWKQLADSANAFVINQNNFLENRFTAIDDQLNGVRRGQLIFHSWQVAMIDYMVSKDKSPEAAKQKIFDKAVITQAKLEKEGIALS